MKVLIINAKNQHKVPHVMLITGTKYVVKQTVKLVTIFFGILCACSISYGSCIHLEFNSLEEAVSLIISSISTPVRP